MHLLSQLMPLLYAAYVVYARKPEYSFGGGGGEDDVSKDLKALANDMCRVCMALCENSVADVTSEWIDVAASRVEFVSTLHPYLMNV